MWIPLAALSAQVALGSELQQPANLSERVVSDTLPSGRTAFPLSTDD